MTNGNYPVPSETVEAGLLNSCATMAQWLELSAFTDDDFSTHRDVFRFISSYLQQYGNLPSTSQLSTRFNWQPPIGDFAYWLEEMRRYALARRVLEIIQDGYAKIGDPNKSLDTMLDRLSLVRSQQSTHVQASDNDIIYRFGKYLDRTQFLFNTDQIIGLRTGMKIIDKTHEGWIPGSLVGIYARPGLGKTWWLIWQGIQSWLDGKNILAISPEMPTNQLGLRLDVLWAQYLGFPLEYNKLRVGDPSIKENYNKVVEIVSQSQRWWTYDSINEQAPSIGDINALIRQHNPDLVLIDGISLLRYEGRAGQTWEQMKELSYGLKNLATIHEIPIIMTHQASNTARGRRSEDLPVGRGDDFHMPSLNDAAYGDAFVGACSDVITMCGDPSSKNVLWYSLRKTRERGWQEELAPRYALAIDFGKGKIIDLSEIGYNIDRVGEEVRRLIV